MADRAAVIVAAVVVGVLGAARLPCAAASGRHARGLLVFRPGRVQVIMGFGIPVSLPHQAVTMGYLLKSNYLTPSNATMFTRPSVYFGSRSARGVPEAEPPSGRFDPEDAANLTENLPSRWHMYSSLQATLEELGAGRGNGRQCLLRAVCEAAAFTMRHDGLFGELLHVLLTPSSTRDPVNHHDDNEFHAAERAGRLARDAQDPVDACGRLFDGCSAGALDLFSRLQDADWP